MKEKMNTYQELSELIPQTLIQMRTTGGDNPLQAGVAGYVDSIQSLTQPQLQDLKTQILAQITCEPELSRRFLLRLLYDATDSVLDNRQLLYL